MNNTSCISREFAYFLKQEHLYSKYRMMRRNEKILSGREYAFWGDVYSRFYVSLVKKYKCEKDIILKLN